MNHTILKEMKKLAKQGDISAQNKLGYMYHYGDGITRKKREAIKWYTLAAEQGNIEAQCNLGNMYRHGMG